MTLKTTFLEESETSAINGVNRNESSDIAHFEGTFDSLHPKPPIICFSHLRWNFVFQRPQHLLTRAAKDTMVFFIEEPIHDDKVEKDSLEIATRDSDNVTVVIPRIKPGKSATEIEGALTTLIDQFVREFKLENYIAWYYTPMALGFTRHLKPALTVFDCMDELSAFAGAPKELLDREKELLRRADLVFTGGYSLYEAKKNLHSNVYAFPSSIEFEHFNSARTALPDPADQQDVAKPRIGFYGVIDERMDVDLVGEVARRRPEWQFVFLGPVVKISPEKLPRHINIHYFGMKSYKELPYYLSNWDVAMLPFALNESTRYISPTKTPEYLAAGKPVVSSAIRDVVKSYGKNNLVHIFDNVDSFIDSVELALLQGSDKEWLKKVDAELSTNSWDITWNKMRGLMVSRLKDLVNS